jgi:hypothetical protein
MENARMRYIYVLHRTLTLLLVLMSLAGCVPSEPPDTPAPTDIPTPDLSEYCIGWDCAMDGVVYAGEAIAGNELEGVLVQLSQYSNCSPTRGEHEAVTGPNGEFSFEVYLHDTDSFRFNVDVDGYEPAQVSFGGFDCLYCSCLPVEIVLQVP